MIQSQPSLNTLRAFEVVARHLNYHTAAKELNVSPAAVKQLVSRLEESIGTALLKRKGRGLILTSAGHAGLNDLSLGIKHMKTAVDKIRKHQQSKQLIITVEPSFSSAWLVPQLAQFRAAYPNISVLIDSSPLMVDLEQSNVDIAIRYGMKNTDALVSFRLLDDKILPACSPAVTQALPANKELKDLLNSSLIHWDTTQLEDAESSQKWFIWENWLAHFGVKSSIINKGLHFSEYSQALQAAIAGQGIILISEPILSHLFEMNLLTCPFKEKATPDIGYDVVTTREAMNNSEVKSFVDWIVKAAKKNGIAA